MRHGKKFNHLSRKAGHRKAMLRNMASSLIQHKRIKTTLAKAKALRKYIEPLCTRAKVNTTHSRRVTYRYLQNKEAMKELFEVIGPKIMDRPGGYVRVIRLGFRPSDAAEVALIEFVDFNEDAIRSEEEQADKKRTRRGRRRKKKNKSTEEASVENESNEEVEEEEENEEVEAVAEEVEETVEEESTETEEETAEEETTEEEESSEEETSEEDEEEK